MSGGVWWQDDLLMPEAYAAVDGRVPFRMCCTSCGWQSFAMSADVAASLCLSHGRTCEDASTEIWDAVRS